MKTFKTEYRDFDGVSSKLWILPLTDANGGPLFNSDWFAADSPSPANYTAIETSLGLTAGSITNASQLNDAISASCHPGKPTCRESQEWTYGVDNSGTDFRWVSADYEVEASDGTIIPFNQTTASNGSWAAQLIEWAASVQAAANAAGVKWFVEPRFVDRFNPSNIDGTINGPGGNPSGLPGAPSEIIAEQLDAAGMVWRYVNFQICPGQPVPVAARLVAVNDQGSGRTPPALPFDLTATPKAILGPINKFKVCESCGPIPDAWYILDETAADDTYRPATAGEIPSCWEPCGVLVNTPAPPESDCSFEFDVGCDNNNSTNTVDFTNTITRRSMICNGEKIAVTYFQADPDDTSALVPYALAGDFVDCATGLPVPLPEPECGDLIDIGTLWVLDDPTPGATLDWWAPASFPGGSNAAPHGNPSSVFTPMGTGLVHANGAPDVTYVESAGFTFDTLSNGFVANVGATGTSETIGTDQVRMSGYIVMKDNGLLQDSSPSGRTGERGGIWIDECCESGVLTLLEETTSNTTDNGARGVFNGTFVPAGIHYIEIVVLDAAAWSDLGLSVSFDGGNSYEPLIGYEIKPVYKCIKVLKCQNSGRLFDAYTDEEVFPGPFDQPCEPKGCNGGSCLTC